MNHAILLPSQDWREVRRFRAWELKQQGWKQCDIATALGVSTGAVSHWLRRTCEGGLEALHRQPGSGRPPRLTVDQRADLPGLLALGAEAFGFCGEVWTTRRVATMIEREFGVRYHPAHVSRLLRALDWSVQQPIQRATQRDEAAIQAWSAERWPALKKGRKQQAEPLSG